MGYVRNGKAIYYKNENDVDILIADCENEEKAHFLMASIQSFNIVGNYVSDARTTLSPSWHGDMVAKAQFLGRINGAIDAANKLDQIKKTLFYGRDNNLIAEGQTPIADHPLQGMGDGNADPANIVHGVIGIFTEAGELLEMLREAYNGNGFDPINMREEIGDLFWYVAILFAEASRDGEGYTFEDAMRINIAKLKARFPAAFQADYANNRDLAVEREILEDKPKAIGFEPPESDMAHGQVQIAPSVPASGKVAVEAVEKSADAAFDAMLNREPESTETAATQGGSGFELDKSPAERLHPLPGEGAAQGNAGSFDERK